MCGRIEAFISVRYFAAMVGHCEVCQASDRELVSLRSFYNVIRAAKKSDMTSAEIQGFLDNIQKELK